MKKHYNHRIFMKASDHRYFILFYCFGIFF